MSRYVVDVFYFLKVFGLPEVGVFFVRPKFK